MIWTYVCNDMLICFDTTRSEIYNTVNNKTQKQGGNMGYLQRERMKFLEARSISKDSQQLQGWGRERGIDEAKQAWSSAAQLSNVSKTND